MMGMMEMNADDPTEAYIEERMNMSSEDKAEVRKGIQALDKQFPSITSKRTRTILNLSVALFMPLWAMALHRKMQPTNKASSP